MKIRMLYWVPYRLEQLKFPDALLESYRSWSDDSFIALKKGIESAGFEILGDGKLSSKFIYFDAVKPL